MTDAEIKPLVQTTQQHSSKAPPAPSTNIQAYVQALMEQQVQKKKITPKTAEQTMQAIALLVEATGKTYFSGLSQRDLSQFKRIMTNLPPSYRKSSADKDKSLDQIIAEAKDRKAGGATTTIGLSAATINRNPTMIGKILRFARADGEDLDHRLDPGLLREEKRTRDREDRPRFESADLERIFAHPVWTGCKSAKRRNDPGSVIV